MTEKEMVMTTHVFMRDGTMLHVLGNREELTQQWRKAIGQGGDKIVEWDVVADSDIIRSSFNATQVFILSGEHLKEKPVKKPGAGSVFEAGQDDVEVTA